MLISLLQGQHRGRGGAGPGHHQDPAGCLCLTDSQARLPREMAAGKTLLQGSKPLLLPALLSALQPTPTFDAAPC